MRCAAVLLSLTMLIAVVLPATCAGTSGEWSAEERLTVQFPTQVSDLVTDVSDDGHAIAAWDCYDQSTMRTSAWVAICDPEKGWTDGALLEGTIYSSGAQDVAIVDNGTAVAVWDTARNGFDRPMAAVYVAGEGWQEIASLSAQQASAIYVMDAAMNENGDIVVAWDAEINNAHLIMASIYSPAAGWSDAATLISSANYQLDPMVGISDRGDALVAWRERVENPDNTYTGILRFSAFSPGSGWAAQAVINDDNVDQGNPVAHMEMNGPGDALLAYSCELAGSDRSESRATFYDGSAWGAATTLSELDDEESSCPDVGLTDDGWGMVVWGQWNGTIQDYQYRTFENGTFGTLETIPHGTLTGFNWPYIDVSGRQAIVTTGANVVGEDVQHAYAVRYDPVDGWSAWERLDPDRLFSIYFLVRGSIDAYGNAMVAWISHDENAGLNCSVWVSSYAVDEAVVQEVDPHQGEIDALRGQLNLAILVAAAAMIAAIASLGLLFWKMRAKKRT